jgi:uncharacterized protein
MKLILTLLDWQKKVFHKILIWGLLSIILSIGLIADPARATSVFELPELRAGEPTWVIDQANAISRANEAQLSNNLSNLAAQTGKEVRMVAIRRLDYNDTMESFTNKLFETWFPTPKEQANQILLAIDILTNGSAIRTGEEVKKLISEDIAQSIAKETVGIWLKEGNKYNQALLDASDRLIAVLSGQPDPGPPEIKDTTNIEGTFATAEETDRKSSTVWVIGLLLAATIIPMATYFFYTGFSN